MVFLAIFSVSIYLTNMDAINILARLSEELLFVLLFGGIAFLTIGIIGIGRLKLKNHKKLFTAITACVIPSLTFALVFLFIIVIIFPSTMFPMRSEITNVTVIGNNPLILSVDLKAITIRDSYIDVANVLNTADDNVVSQCVLDPFFVLPAYSTKTLILTFNNTIPSGNYIVMLSSWDYHQGNSPFAIP